MLTPGTSQDKHPRHSIAHSERRRRRPRILDASSSTGVNNTWPRWAIRGELRDGRDPEFKVSTSTYKAEYGLATGGLVPRDQVGHEPECTDRGCCSSRDASVTAKEFFPDGEAGLSAAISTAAPSADRSSVDKTHFFFAYEGTNRTSLHRERARSVAAV